MPLAWPPTLPTIPLYGGSEGGEARLIQQETEVGPGKLRSRYTRGLAPILFPMILTIPQATALMDFYNTTTGGGALSFDFLHPRSGAAIVCRFRPGSGPLLGNFSFGKYRVTLQLEIVPT